MAGRPIGKSPTPNEGVQGATLFELMLVKNKFPNASDKEISANAAKISSFDS